MTQTVAQVPEIERAVITLLTQREAAHPALRAWVAALVSDRAEQRTLREFPVSDELRAALAAEPGFRLPGPGRNLVEMIDGCEAYDMVTRVDGATVTTPYQRRVDQAILWLAEALALFRATGRPTGDTEQELHGVGGPLAVVSTSLSAALVQYVHLLQNALAIEVNALRDELMEARPTTPSAL